MSVFDDFSQNTLIYKGKVPEAPQIDNIEQLIADHGKEWFLGYLKAMEVIGVDLANVIQPRDNNPCGFEQTPNLVRTNLKKYWNHNKSLYVSLSSHLHLIETTSNNVKPR